MDDTTCQRTRQELAQRKGGGIEVTLSWSPDDDTLTVQVIDHFDQFCAGHTGHHALDIEQKRPCVVAGKRYFKLACELH